MVFILSELISLFCFPSQAQIVIEYYITLMVHCPFLPLYGNSKVGHFYRKRDWSLEIMCDQKQGVCICYTLSGEREDVTSPGNHVWSRTGHTCYTLSEEREDVTGPWKSCMIKNRVYVICCREKEKVWPVPGNRVIKNKVYMLYAVERKRRCDQSLEIMCDQEQGVYTCYILSRGREDVTGPGTHVWSRTGCIYMLYAVRRKTSRDWSWKLCVITNRVYAICCQEKDKTWLVLEIMCDQEQGVHVICCLKKDKTWLVLEIMCDQEQGVYTCYTLWGEREDVTGPGNHVWSRTGCTCYML